jgi:NAD(P)-dependent dehydrogenase (short-subunit alcohol dehydrogenase family)
VTGGTGDSFPDSAPGGRRRSGHTRNPRHAAVPEPLGPLHVPAADDILAAIGIHQRTGISFWDAMIARSAAEIGFDAYYATKFALEGLAQTLSQEVDFGVTFLIVEPGAFRTALFNPGAAYTSAPMPVILAIMIRGLDNSSTAESVW